MAGRRTTDGSRGGVFGRDTSVSLSSAIGPRGSDGLTGASVLAVTEDNMNLPIVVLSFWNSLLGRDLDDNLINTVMYDVTAMAGADGAGIADVSGVPNAAGDGTTVTVTLNDGPPASTFEFNVPDGIDGMDGMDGAAGASVTGVTVNADGTLTFTLSEGSPVTTADSVVGPQGIGITAGQDIDAVAGAEANSMIPYTVSVELTDPSGTTPADVDFTFNVPVVDLSDLIEDADILFTEAGATGDQIRAIRVGTVIHPIASTVAPAGSIPTYTSAFVPGDLVESSGGPVSAVLTVTIGAGFTIPSDDGTVTATVAGVDVPLTGIDYDGSGRVTVFTITALVDVSVEGTVDFVWTIPQISVGVNNIRASDDTVFVGATPTGTETITILDSNTPAGGTITDNGPFTQFTGVQSVTVTATIDAPYSAETLMITYDGTAIAASPVVSSIIEVTRGGVLDPILTTYRQFSITQDVITTDASTTAYSAVMGPTLINRSNIAYTGTDVTPIPSGTVRVTGVNFPSQDINLVLTPTELVHLSTDNDVVATLTVGPTGYGLPSTGAPIVITRTDGTSITNLTPVQTSAISGTTPTLYTEFTGTQAVDTSTAGIVSSWTVTTTGLFYVPGNTAVTPTESTEQATVNIATAGTGGEYYYGFLTGVFPNADPTSANITSLGPDGSDFVIVQGVTLTGPSGGTQITTVPSEFTTNGSFVVAIPQDSPALNTQLYLRDVTTGGFNSVAGVDAVTTENAIWRRTTQMVGPTNTVYDVFMVIAAPGAAGSLDTIAAQILEVR